MRNNELQAEILRLQEENEKLKVENEQLKKPCLVMPKVNQLAVPIEEFKKLQQENEELKQQLEFSRTHKTVLDAERIKYKQALEEIREIAFDELDKTDADDELTQIYGTIYNKCSGVLNDRN